MTAKEIIPRVKEFDVALMAEHLGTSGIVIVEGYVQGEGLETLNSEFDALQQAPTNGWLEHREYGKGTGRLVTTAGITQEYAQTKKAFSHPGMKELLSSVAPGIAAECNEKIWVVRDVVGTSHLAQDLHFDVARTLKFFLYLTDTDASNGAFACLPGSLSMTQAIRKRHGSDISYENRHLSRVPEQTVHAVSVEGKGGDLIVFDTDTLHMAGQCTSGERRVMRAQSSVLKSDVEASLIHPTGFWGRIKRKLKAH